jgi:hypothetical protein
MSFMCLLPIKIRTDKTVVCEKVLSRGHRTVVFRIIGLYGKKHHVWNVNFFKFFFFLRCINKHPKDPQTEFEVPMYKSTGLRAYFFFFFTVFTRRSGTQPLGIALKWSQPWYDKLGMMSTVVFYVAQMWRKCDPSPLLVGSSYNFKLFWQ